MDDTKAPATKADIMGLENRLGERFDEIDDRFDNLGERMDSGFNEVLRKLDRASENRRQLHERVDNHEQRLTAVETAVGIDA